MSGTAFGKLGKGISSLINEQKNGGREAGQGSENLMKIPPSRLHPSPYQPRTEFDPESLRELADSIGKNGIIQPIVARLREKNEYEIIAGERRWRAAKMLNLETIPVIIRELPDRDCMEMALVENIQRRDLSPLEEAQAYRRLLGEFGYTQESLSKVIGKSRSHVANILRLLTLPDSIKQMVRSGALSMGHARSILGAANPDYVAQKVIEQKLSVRETEDLIHELQNPPKPEEEIEPVQPEPEPEITLEPVVDNQEIASVETALAVEIAVAVEQPTTPVIAEAIMPETIAVQDNNSEELSNREQAIREAEQAIARAVRNIGIDADDLGEVYASPRSKNPDIIMLEERLTEQLGCKVHIKSRGKRGEILIKYRGLDQLDKILQLLSARKPVSAAA